MTKNKLFVIVLSVILVVAAGLYILVISGEKFGQSVLFYNVPEEECAKIEAVLAERFMLKTDTSQPAQLPFHFKKYNGTKPLADFLKQDSTIFAVIAEDGRSVFESRYYFNVINAEHYNKLPSTFLHSVFMPNEDNTQPYTYPVLLNTVAFVYNTEFFKNLQINVPQTIEDWASAFMKCKESVNYPFVCSGADDKTLLFLISAIMNFVAPNADKEKLAKFIQSGEDERKIDSDLKRVLDILVDWRQKGFLHPEWFRLVDRDVAIFMEFKSAAVGFMSLQQYRHIKKEVTQTLTAAAIPLSHNMQHRNLAANVFVLATINGKNVNKKLADEFFDFVTSNEGQAHLSQITGFAPANSQASAYDSQASNARYWAASSNMVLPDFTETLKGITPEQKAACIKKIRLYLEVNGIGFTEESAGGIEDNGF